MNLLNKKLYESDIELKDIKSFTRKIEILDGFFTNILEKSHNLKDMISFEKVSEIKTHISGISHSLQYVYGDLSRLNQTIRDEILGKMHRIGFLFLTIARSQYENKEFFIQCVQDVRSILKYDEVLIQAIDLEVKILLRRT